MSNRYLRWVLRLHPRAWRQRYGEEVYDLSEELLNAHEAGRTRLVLGLVGSALHERIRGFTRLGRFAALSVFAAMLVVAGAVALVANLPGSPPSISNPSHTAGTVLPSQNGSVNPKKIPDFIATVGRTGKFVGYIPRAYVFPSNPVKVNSPVSSKLGSVAPVYARNLETLVGHMFPGVGFVPLGASPTSEPCLPESTMAISADGTAVTQSINCPSTIESVPNIVGVYLPTAMARVSSLSLTAQITYVHSESVPAGYVISVTPSTGTRIRARSEIKVFSSLGAHAG